jgi:hypothetical protein
MVFFHFTKQALLNKSEIRPFSANLDDTGRPGARLVELED